MATLAPSLPIDSAADRAATNRDNAQHSTGPRTEEGKSRMRLNACQHGIYSKTVILPGEDQSQFDALGQTYIERYQPQNAEQTELVETLQATQWRLSRIVALEINLHTVGASEYLDAVEARFGPLDESSLYALARTAAFSANHRMFDQLSRQEGRLQRLYDRTRQALDLLLEQRRTPAIAKPTAATGFVSPISTDTMPKFTGPLADIKRKQWIRQQETLKVTKQDHS